MKSYLMLCLLTVPFIVDRIISCVNYECEPNEIPTGKINPIEIYQGLVKN